MFSNRQKKTIESTIKGVAKSASKDQVKDALKPIVPDVIANISAELFSQVVSGILGAALKIVLKIENESKQLKAELNRLMGAPLKVGTELLIDALTFEPINEIEERYRDELLLASQIELYRALPHNDHDAEIICDIYCLIALTRFCSKGGHRFASGAFEKAFEIANATILQTELLLENLSVEKKVVVGGTESRSKIVHGEIFEFVSMKSESVRYIPDTKESREYKSKIERLKVRLKQIADFV